MAKIIPAKNSTKKEAITQKASKLFKEKGFSATSMRDIAEVFGVEAPSLYNHVNSKNEILQDICFKIANLFTNHINKIEISDLPAIDKLELIIRFHIHMMLQDYESVYISDHEWKHLPEPHLSNFKNQRKSYRVGFANVIEKGIENKELKKIDPYVAVLTILSAIGGIESWQNSKKNIDAGSLEENMVSILLGGLKNSQYADELILDSIKPAQSKIINIKP
ncbi:MAG: TetR/AcrR family transcriptional regulator [Ginsengibacter sp.]